jgi:sarcosine oxidase subunit beta
MQKFSALLLPANALGGHKGWRPQRRSTDSNPANATAGADRYGVAIAFCAANEHDVYGVTVIAKGWPSGGNTRRNVPVAWASRQRRGRPRTPDNRPTRVGALTS